MSPTNGNRRAAGATADSVGDLQQDAAEPTLTPATTQATRRIDEILVGERHRRDMGDLAGLAASMAELGLLHPIVVRPDGTLIAGERRLRAAKQLGWSEIPVTVVDLKAVVAGEFAENAIRKDFTLSEAVAIKRALDPIEREAAKERQRESKGRGKKGGQVAPPLRGRAADKAAQATGMARRTLEKAEAVIDAAEAEPERFGKLLADMDRTGEVNGVYRRLKIARQAALIRAEPPPLPGRGPYRVISADPPWFFDAGDEGSSQRGIGPYPRMMPDEICALPVASIAASDSVLWLWTTNFHLAQGIATTVIRAWGFEPRTILTWVKDRMGTGFLLRGQTEHCLVGVRGNPTFELTNQTTVLHAPVRGHSVKPPEFYTFVESLCPAPRYADLFSRYRHNERWDCHGDEAPPTDPPPELTDIPDFLLRVAP